MNAAYMIWDEPLQKLCDERTMFYKSIVMSLLGELGSSFSAVPDEDVGKEASFHWLKHLLTSTKWKSERSAVFALRDLRTEIMEFVLLNPSIWSFRVAEMLLQNEDERFRQDWTAMYNASKISSNQRPLSASQSETHPEDIDMVDAVPSKETNLGILDSPLTNGGWKLWEGSWTPRPIGI